jgi:uncharacterized membrane protein
MVHLAQPGLKIDWTKMPTYNTIMSVAAGAGLIMVVRLAREVIRDPKAIVAEAWSLGFAVVSVILVTTGLHMTLTWPLAVAFPFDNIIFGEPSLAFGVLLGAASLFLWRRGSVAIADENVAAYLARVSRPVSVFIFGIGLGLFGIAVAGVTYQLFAAPPEEPISGMFAKYPLIEAVAISGLYALVGLGAVLFPWALESHDRAAGLRLVVGWSWTIAGVVFLLFGAMNYFTHIGLIVHTM